MGPEKLVVVQRWLVIIKGSKFSVIKKFNLKAHVFKAQSFSVQILIRISDVI
jgi:hypothetical protein